MPSRTRPSGTRPGTPAGTAGRADGESGARSGAGAHYTAATIGGQTVYVLHR
jgi:hypothetical protein